MCFYLMFYTEPEVLDLTETSCRIVWSAYRLPVSSDSVIYLVEVTRTRDSQEPIVVLPILNLFFDLLIIFFYRAGKYLELMYV